MADDINVSIDESDNINVSVSPSDSIQVNVTETSFGTLQTSDTNTIDLTFSNNTLSAAFVPTANVSMASNKLVDVADPTSAQDAATKAYVDAQSGGVSFWDRAGTTLSPSTAGDNVTTSGVLSTTNTTAGSSNTTGALTVSGGVGIAKNLYAGTDANTINLLFASGSLYSHIFSYSSSAQYLMQDTGGRKIYLSTNRAALDSVTTTEPAIAIQDGSYVLIRSNQGTTTSGIVLRTGSAGSVSIPNTTASTSSSTGALVVSGGAGISGAVNTNVTSGSTLFNFQTNTSANGFFTLPSTQAVFFQSSGVDAATAISTTKDSPALYLRGTYWNGSAASSADCLILNDVTGTGPNYRMSFRTANTERFYIDESGVVAITRSTTAATRLNIINTSNNAFIGNDGTDTALQVASSTSIKFQTGAGFGVVGTISSAGVFNVATTTDSSSISTGALTVAGGIGITKSAVIGTGLLLSSVNSGLRVEGAVFPTGTGPGFEAGYSSGGSTSYFQSYNRTSSAFAPLSISGSAISITQGDVSITNTTASTSTTTGALKVAGGAGVAGNIFAGGDSYSFGTALPIVVLQSSTTTSPYGFSWKSGSSVDATITHQANTASLTISSGRSAAWGGDINFVIDTASTMTLDSTKLAVLSTTASTSTITGALIVAGGAGIAGSIYAGSLVLSTDLAVTEGGTGASTAAGAVTNLGLDNTKIASVGITIDGGGSAITTGSKGYISIPYAGTVSDWTILADQSGSIVVDIKKCNYAGFPTTSSIAGSEKPTLSSAQKNQDTSLGSFTTAVTAGDIWEFVVDSASTVTRAHIIFKIIKT